MITQLKFQNFRILQDATLPLGRVTVIIGPNGSGKSTALNGLRLFSSRQQVHSESWRSVGASAVTPDVQIIAESSAPSETASYPFPTQPRPGIFQQANLAPGNSQIRRVLALARIFAFESAAIASPAALERTLELNADGGKLPSLLTTLQDQFPERFESLNEELSRWMPEFDRIVLDTLPNNQRVFMLRTKLGKHRIPAQNLSQGNLLSTAVLSLSHLPSPPTVLGLEEVDRGIHPRLLRDVQDAVMRLAYPENFGDDREPVQVIMTTHSPYFVDLFRDHPEDIVIAEKDGLTASFKRLVDLPNVEEILRDSPLGEAWFSGILGGVPVGT